MKLLLFGIIVHLIFLYSIFDIYFISPITHGATPASLEGKAPAKRLVLFVADGLRADKFFEVNGEGKSRAPYLRNIIEKEGSWGVSHTRMPTESRPGHVALIAGFYEDVSAVARGWKENPVEFDSVFNQSAYTWSWGSPDILPMFAKGSTGNHVFTEMYSSDHEEFGGNDAYTLDLWVFDKVKDFLGKAAKNETLRHMLNSDKIVFFLHLLGLDTNGHSHKPMSSKYLENIEFVDKGISQIVDLINKFYNNDQKTAFIMTSDHGMTDWGSHGAGDPEETLTPFVAWGAGIRQPLKPGRTDVYHDQLDFDWSLSHVKRVDVNQADIAPLMASLIGINFPMNSMGILPVDVLIQNWAYRADAMHTNWRQLLKQYHLKRDNRKKSRLYFQPFKEFSESVEHERIDIIKDLSNVNRHEELVQFLYRTILVTQKGIDYYNRYDQFILKLMMSLSYVGWMMHLFSMLIQDHTSILSKSLEVQKQFTESKQTNSTNRYIPLYALFLCMSILLFVQSSPLLYYVYFNLPILLWYMVFQRWTVFIHTKDYIFNQNLVLKFLKLSCFGFFGTQLLILAFFHRYLLSLGFILTAFWPYFSNLNLKKDITFTWGFLCVAMAIFPMLPTVGKQTDSNLVILSGIISLILMVFSVRRPELGLLKSGNTMRREPLRVVVLIFAQICILLLSIIILKNTSDNISRDSSVPIINHILSWAILVTSFVLPLLGSRYILTRLVNIGCSLMAVYLLLSSSHEGLFLLVFAALLLSWLIIEYILSSPSHALKNVTFTLQPTEKSQLKAERALCSDDFRRAYFFIYFILSAFFGTGNIASLNSFDVSSVFCFITVFNPFVMGGLLMLKVLIPFLLVTCFFRSIHLAIKLPTRGLLLIVLLVSDFMSLHFFFYVKDSGSWLDIGTSISHYVIVMAIIIFVLIFNALATVFTSFNLSISNNSIKLHRL